jgi:alpha-L-arabinofuranosidase
MEKIMALRPAFIRWPGGNVAQDYHWQWGIGPRDERPTWVNMSWADDPEPSDFGTPEYLAFCAAIGAEPTIVVNVEGRGVTLNEASGLRAEGQDIRKQSRQATAEEAANWVEYSPHRTNVAPSIGRIGRGIRVASDPISPDLITDFPILDFERLRMPIAGAQRPVS